MRCALRLEATLIHVCVIPPAEEQLKVITRGIEKIVPQEELRKKLQHSQDTGVP